MKNLTFSSVLYILLLFSLLDGFAQTELEGTWIGYEMGGPPGDVTIVLINDSAHYIGQGGVEWYKGSFVINVDTLPKQFDIFVEEAFTPPLVGETALAIYELLGDSVHVAINAPGNLSRPVDFTLGSGTRIFMLGLQPTSAVETSSNIPDKFNLFQNYPNPFNPSTKIRFTINESRFTTLKVYDILGNEIATLVNEKKPAGEYEVEFSSHSGEGRNLSSGIYFYQLKVGSFIQTKKMVLLR